MDKFCQQFEAAIPALRKKILAELKLEKNKSKAGYRSVWEHYEAIINKILIDFFVKPPLSIPRSDLTEPSGKSTYPDLKIAYKGNLYAVDVKSADANKSPEYDIARIDTFEKSRLDIYKEEYCIVVKRKGRENSEVVDVYIEPTFKTVGRMQKNPDRIKYRLYDGKIRPKSWKDFEKETSIWKTPEDFKKAFELARDYRQNAFIKLWYANMNTARRNEIKKILENIDKGKLSESEINTLLEDDESSS